MRRVGTATALIALGALWGCSSTGGATQPLNPAAQRLGPIAIAFVNTGLGSGPVQITMADGEVLNGSYRNSTLSGGDLSPLPSFPVASDLLIGDGPVQFVANGPKTTIYCRGHRTLGGNGNGQCQTASGALWSISW